MKRLFGRSASPIAVVVAVVAFLVTGCGSGGVGSGPPAPASLTAAPTTTPPDATATTQPTPTKTLMALHDDALAAGRYVATPFTPPNMLGLCMHPTTTTWTLPLPPQPGCTESAADDSIRFTFTVPDGWSSCCDNAAIFPTTGTTAPGGQSIHLLRGGWLYSDPCHALPPPDIQVGTTVAEFVSALADHPAWEATTPVDATLGGYSGKYMDLQLPSDISKCTSANREGQLDIAGGFWPWEPGFRAQGPSHRWHVWALDVDGVRVVIQTGDFAGTSAHDRAELKAIVDSIRIEH